ncbi:MAG TPA: type II/IV secretion system protein [bacterium]|nr:type II/IV secretion system protein [bacterium]
MTLIQQLVKKGVIDKEKAASLEHEIKNSNKKEEQIILEKGITSEDFLYRLKSENLRIPLKNVDVEEIPLKVLELIPEESAKYYKMVPLIKKGNILEVGAVYPSDLKVQEALKFLARQGEFTYQVFLITPTTFKKLLKQYKTLKKEIGRALEELETELKTEKKTPLKKEEIEKMVEEAPVTKIVAVILKHAVEGKSSDIHIEPSKEKLKIRFRLDGILHSTIILPKRLHSAVVARIKILSNLKLDETRIPQDGRFSTKVGKKDIDFRVSTFPTTLGEKVVLRVLDSVTSLKDLSSLGLEGKNLEIVKKNLKKAYGMLLVTGPTGSGKTTTLYVILNSLNTEEVNIVTLEDPVEYFIEGVNQSQVRPDIKYTFARGLRHILRQDPDIIMVGEIRDEETASLATHAALTGHIMLSTIHTTNSLGVIPRLIDLGIKPFLIPPTLNIIIAQRLVRVLCPICKKETKPNLKIKEIIAKEIKKFPAYQEKELKDKKINIFEPKGCKKCNSKGYSGRIGIFEVLEMSEQLADIILKNPSEGDIEKEAKRQGMITMRQDGILKVLDGVTSIEEVLRTTKEH